MAANADRCSHCGKAGVWLKRCSRCKHASYCGAACQKVGWKGHRKMCVPVDEVLQKVYEAGAAEDWRGMLKWEGRMEEQMAFYSDITFQDSILRGFAVAHEGGWNATSSQDHARAFVELEERRNPILSKLELFRDQGEAMCEIARMLLNVERGKGAETWFQRARDVGAAHGFFSVESEACMGLGRIAMHEERHKEGVELLRNALAAAQLNETDNSQYETDALAALIDALFTTDAIDDVEPLVVRYREAAKAESVKAVDGLSFYESYSLVCSARLHEVPPRVGTPFTQIGPSFQPVSLVRYARLHGVLCICTPR